MHLMTFAFTYLSQFESSESSEKCVNTAYKKLQHQLNANSLICK